MLMHFDKKAPDFENSSNINLSTKNQTKFSVLSVTSVQINDWSLFVLPMKFTGQIEVYSRRHSTKVDEKTFRSSKVVTKNQLEKIMTAAKP